MVKDKNGKWITSPCTSPENDYLTPEGYRGATFYGATADLAMIRELFEDFIKALKILEIENSFTKKIIQTHINLHPYSIRAKGHLQEWSYDWKDYDSRHRHLLRLFGFTPWASYYSI